MEKKKKIKIWGKIKLFETSAVGIAAYPDAHLSANSFSLIKALSESSDQLNGETDIMKKDEEVETPEEPKPEEPEKKEEPEAPKEPEKEPEKPEEPKEPEKAGPLTIDDLQKVVDKAMEKAMKGSETERGLVFTEDEALKELKDKSIGELAMMGGLFKPN